MRITLAEVLFQSSNGVVAFVQGVLVFVAGALPVVMLLSIFFIPLFWFFRMKRKRNQDDTASAQD